MALLTPTLQLGDFEFVGFEEPESITFGKEQETYKHILIGGGRVIDMLGAGDPDITWSGYLTGFQAEDRARYLEQITKEGQQLTLTTSQFIKQVVIKSFTYGFHFVYPIEYTITVHVVNDLTLPVDVLVPGDLTQSIVEALIQAQDIATLIDDGSVSSAIALASIAAQNAAPFDGATNTQIIAALAAAQNAKEVIDTAISASENSIFG